MPSSSILFARFLIFVLWQIMFFGFVVCSSSQHLPSCNDLLRLLSIPLFNTVHWKQRIRIGVRKFTLANTGLDKANNYIELGSVYKASFMKAALWFFASVAIEISEKHPDELWLIFYFRGVFFLYQFFPSIKRTVPPAVSSRIQCCA